MDLNKLRESALMNRPSQLLQSGELGARIASDTEEILTLSPEDIRDGASQEKRNFLGKLRAISKEGE